MSKRHCTPVDLMALIRAEAEEAQRLATGHRLRVEAVVQELVGTWDEVRLERVVRMAI